MNVNAQQFSDTQDYIPYKVNEASAYSIKQKLDSLTTLVEKLVVRQVQQIKTCGICYASNHPIDKCPTLQDDLNAHVKCYWGLFKPFPKGV